MSNNQTHSTAVLPYFVATFESCTVAIKRDAEYNAVIKYIQKSISKLRLADAQNIYISITLPEYGDTFIRISEETWPDLMDHVKSAQIILDHDVEARCSCSKLCARGFERVDPAERSENVASAISATNRRAEDNLAQTIASEDIAVNPDFKGPHSWTERFSITLLTKPWAQFQLDNVHRTSSIRKLKAQIEYESGIPVALQRLTLLGRPPNDALILEQAGVIEGTALNLALNTRKSAIYCFAPRRGNQDKFTLNNVKLGYTLNRAWELVALASSDKSNYCDYIQSKSWNVDVARDGSIWDHSSQTELEYLFWDGASKHSIPLPVELKPSCSMDWMRCTASLEFHNSAVVLLQEVRSYISTVLSSVGFDPRSKFPRLFMRSIQSKPWTHIAVRFLRGVDSEK
ncbi:hypothetical protein FRC12_000746 [Ceratobasidium sp. 428]|nr:hypothetical protein FRC12_000746 [Ceratobasidium sp. 428]